MSALLAPLLAAVLDGLAIAGFLLEQTAHAVWEAEDFARVIVERGRDP